MATKYGTGASEVIVGTARDDHLFGSLGRDTLYGLGGDDTLAGGRGRDILNGGLGFDLASYADNRTPVLVSLLAGVARTPERPWTVDHLTGIEAVEGGKGDDTLIGDGESNLLSGSDGVDKLIGGIGADTLSGGAGNDDLYGGIGPDTLRGGDGYDWLFGGAGNNALFGGNDGDTLYLDATDGHSVLNGGRGDDFANLVGAADYLVRLNSGIVWVDGELRARLSSIESIEVGTLTSSGDDTVIGSSGADIIQVNGGANVVYAGAGDDEISSRLSNHDGEILNGGAGNDTIYSGYSSGDSHRIFAGGAGDDFIRVQWGALGATISVLPQSVWREAHVFARTRWRRRSNPARPYMVRFSILRRLI